MSQVVWLICLWPSSITGLNIKDLVVAFCPYIDFLPFSYKRIKLTNWICFTFRNGTVKWKYQRSNFYILTANFMYKSEYLAKCSVCEQKSQKAKKKVCYNVCGKEEIVGWISLGQMRKRCRPAIGGSWYTSVLNYFNYRIFWLKKRPFLFLSFLTTICFKNLLLGGACILHSSTNFSSKLM